uniref:NADH-ubiquinone oxidoreductase chain 3 n=1 Tax=Cymus sp. TaxID=2931286 RepID=A0A8T9ZWY1_9HEMI|nr:NADH dehydrogenase subunit 3 [Cymus sp.]
MMKIILAMMLSTIISALLMLILSMISKHSMNDREKMTPFECGFDPKSKARMPFSIQFFLIAVLFLIFDIEIAIILPMIISMKTSNIMSWSITVMTFLTILTVGLYYEWYNNMLEWSK